ncbi:MAG: OsmC family protein [Planctomycetota bacterium]
MSNTTEGYKATATIGNVSFKTGIEVGGHSFVSDAPAEHGGDDTAASPMALLAASLASCKAMTCAMYAKRKGWPVERIDVVVQHSQAASDGDSSKPRDRFHADITIVGDVDSDQQQRIYDIAARCPVHKALTGSQLTSDLRA